MKNRFALFIIIFCLFGCSHYGQKSSTEHVAAVEDETSNNQEVIGQKLSELSKLAKAQGPDKVIYLASSFYLKASAAAIEGDYHSANILLKVVDELVPDDIFVKRKLAMGLVRSNKIDEAKKYFEQIASHKDHTEQDTVLMGGVHTSLGEYDDARKVYKKLFSSQEYREEACVFYSKTFALEEKHKVAIDHLKDCQKKYPRSGSFDYYIAKIYLETGNISEAKAHYQRSIAKDAKYTESVVELGFIYEEEKEFLKAEVLYRNYLRLDAQNTNILNRIVQLYFSTGEFKKVMPYAERLSELEADNLNLKVKLGVLYTDAKEFDKAIGLFKELLAHAPDNDKILYYIAAIYQERTDYKDAIDYYGRIPVDSSLYQDSIKQTASMLSNMALTERSLKKEINWENKFYTYLDNKLTNVPDLLVELNVMKANYFENIDENEKAIKILEGVKRHRDFNNKHRYFLAALHEKEDNYSEAAELIIDVLNEDPHDAHAWNFLGYTLLERLGQNELAKEYIMRALSLGPQDPYIRDSLGWYYYKIGENEKALKELIYASNKVGDDPSILKHLAIVYTALKNFKEARFWTEKALTWSQDPEEKSSLELALQSLNMGRIPANFLEK